jgi:hypothetical protein
MFHDAYLVESYRDEQGSPRQRTLCYLGNVRRIEGHIPHVESELFLTRAGHILRRAALSLPIDSEAVLEELRGQLPALTPDAALRAFEAQVSWFYDWWSQHGTSSAEYEIARVVSDIMGDVQERTR